MLKIGFTFDIIEINKAGSTRSKGKTGNLTNRTGISAALILEPLSEESRE